MPSSAGGIAPALVNESETIINTASAETTNLNFFTMLLLCCDEKSIAHPLKTYGA
jgi:hypothetical protein